jgi:hypothetical protein
MLLGKTETNEHKVMKIYQIIPKMTSGGITKLSESYTARTMNCATQERTSLFADK